jgi:mannose-6-phosphate isomerase-like protein (cupin superfamily)
MAERERTRIRERAAPALDSYEKQLRARKDFQDRQLMGAVVIRSTDRKFDLTRQAHLKYYLDSQTFKDTPLQDWLVFVNDVKKHSGKHRHQGGLVIYVIEGRGYSVVDDERIEWEAGDLLLLPIKPEGVVHQHFNHAPGEPCVWIAFCHMPIMDYVSMEMTQIEAMPEFKEG